MKVLVVTGQLASDTVKRYVRKSPVPIEVMVLPKQVAALMTTRYIAEALASRDLTGFDMILVPGMMMGDTLQIQKKVGVPTFKGPRQAADLPAVLNQIAHDKKMLSTTRPACELLGDNLKRRAIKELNRLRSETAEKAKRLGKFAIGSDAGRVWVGRDLPPLILAEIVNAQQLSKRELQQWARYYVRSGADIIDVGMAAGGGQPEGAARAVKVLKQTVRKPVSIDSNDVEEIRSAVEAGVDLILSVNADNMPAVAKFASEVPVVVTPISTESTPTGVAEKVANLERNIAQAKSLGFKRIIGDLILNPPLLPSLQSSLEAYYRFAERNPETPLLMGIGNVTELVDVDSIGVNFILAALGFELGAAVLFTTEASDKTRGCVRELSTAVQMLQLAKKRGSPPKDLGADLLIFKEKRRVEPPAEKLPLNVKVVNAAERPKFTYDQKGCFKIALDRRRGKIIMYHYPTGSTKPKLVIRGRRPVELYTAAIAEGLISSLSHAAYLGSELEKARLALETGRSYIQDRTTESVFYKGQTF
ncbi:MAG: dihydropteroate synthase-like protein [Candidatus Bathyarchaeia archaeon]